MMIFGFLPQNAQTQTVAVAFSIAWLEAGVEPQPEDARARERLMGFRRELYRCFTARADVLFELAEAVLCAGGPVKTLAGLPLPRAADGRLMLAVDVSNWLRPGAVTSPGRLFCHVYGRGKGQAQMIPGWPYSVVAALEPGRTSWTAVLDAVRLGPDDDEAEITAAQVRDVITRLIDAGHWCDGDPDILVIFDAGYDPMRLACRLADLPVQVLGRLRSDRVLHFPAPPGRRDGKPGRPPRHGTEARRRKDLARPARHHGDRDNPLRHRGGLLLGPPAPPAHPPLGLAGPPRPAAGHRRHPDPPGRRSPARRPGPQAHLAMVLGDRRRPR